jgi:hypothetical protein
LAKEEEQAMSVMDDHTISLQRTRRRRNEREYRWVFWCAYPLFLAAAVIARLIPGRRSAGKPRQSVFREAWANANSTIPFAFMN